MELFKPDGTLKKRSALLAHYNDYLVANARQEWEAEMKAQHASLYPETVEVTEMVEDEEVTKRVPNPDYVSYSEWMAEAKKAVIKDGMETSSAIAEVAKLVREFVAPESVGDVELDAYLATIPSYVKAYGEMYGEYRVPFKNEDAMGLLQVKAAFEMGITSTKIEFSNGTIMPIGATEFSAFALWFAEKRNGYFV
jgi:hypothetical protein